MIRLLLPCLAPLLALAPAGAAPQDVPAGGRSERAQREYPSTTQVEVRAFRPQHVSANELYQVVHDMIARPLMLYDEESQDMVRVTNLQLLGDSLLLYDLPGNLERYVTLLEKVDAQQAAARPAATARVTREYRPRYLSLQALSEALRPFDRAHQGERNIQYVSARGVVVLHDGQERVDEVLAFLGRIDVPSPQVMLTAHVLTPGEGADGLPAELVQGLTRLTGESGFQRVALGMVRTAVDAGGQVSLQLDGGPAGAFLLQLRLGAFDATTRTLTLTGCQLVDLQGGSLFSTATTLEEGVFTVLGATGQAPLFVVLHAAHAAR